MEIENQVGNWLTQVYLEKAVKITPGITLLSLDSILVFFIYLCVMFGLWSVNLFPNEYMMMMMSEYSFTPENKPFEGVRVDPFSFAGVPCGDDLSSLPVMPPLPRRLIGLSDGGFGSEGRVGLTGGGPGAVSSMMWAHMLSNLTANIHTSSLPHCMHKN